MKALVIPVERISQSLLRLLDSLPPGEFATTVVVDDGGGRSELDHALRERGVVLLRHAVPVGRGAAVRAGLHAALAEYSALDSAVIATEADSAEAIVNIASRTGALALATGVGQRTHRGVRALAGVRVSDPWARLRTIPAKLIPHLLTLESRGDAFDVQTVVLAAEHGVRIEEAPVPERGVACRGTFAATARFLAVTRPARAMTRLLAGVCAIVFAGVIALCAYGFASGDLFHQFLWLPWGLHRLVHFGALFTGWSTALLLMFPWAYAATFATLLTGATAWAEGPMAVAAVLFFLLSAHSLGAACARRMPGKSRLAGAGIIQTLLGAGIYSLLMNWTARLPIHYPALWFGLLALPIAADFRAVLGTLRSWRDALLSLELPNWRERGAIGLLLFVLSIQWFGALGPESSADGMTMHLAVCADIHAHHALTFQPANFVWSLMPMGADFTYSIVYLLGGEASASLLNFALLALLAGLVYAAARRWLGRDAALIVTALFASTPLVNLVTGSLFIENFVAAMIVGAAMALWHFHDTGEARGLYLAAALAGAAGSAKFGALAFLIVALAIGAWGVRRRHSIRPAIVAAALLLVFAAPPYAIAYAKSGNPVFPFLNTRFPSRLLEHGIEFRNNQFTEALSWKTPFDMTFHTSRYLEGLNGAIGFGYLLLIPFAVVALFAARGYGARIASAIALFAGAAVLASQPYARYVYPAMPLLAIPYAALTARFAARQRWLYTGLLAAAVLCIGLNVYFTPASGWYHKDLYSPAIFRRNGRARVIAQDIPLRDVTIRFRQAHPQDHVLLLVEPDLADAGASAYEYHWHEYSVWKQIAHAETVSAVRGVFAQLGVRYFISRRPGPDDDLLAPWSLAEFLSNCTSPIVQNGRFFAAQTTPECETLPDAALEARLASLPPALVGAGAYDDFDPALRFHGAWTRSKAFEGPYRHSISYTDSSGADAAFAFEGTALTYIFTKSFNRGVALLEIDGAPHEIDLYAPATQWQAREEFTGLAPGRHLAVLRATGRKRPEAKDAYIDLDAFIAR